MADPTVTTVADKTGLPEPAAIKPGATRPDAVASVTTADAGAEARDAQHSADDAEDDGPPFDLRASIARLRGEIRTVIETLTVPQFAIGLGAVLMTLGLTLLPPPIAIGHLMLGVGAIMMVLAVVWGTGVARPVETHEPDIARVVGMVEGIDRKIEHLKDTQWELSESESRYRDLLDAQDDVILRRDAAGRLTFCNRAFSRVFGVDGAQVLGHPFRPVVHEGDSAETSEFGDDLRRTYSQRIETAEGFRWYAWEEQIIPAGEGQAQEYQCVGRDVTKDRQAQQLLAEARDSAQAASRAKSRFLAVMSHEIRTPMNGILGMTSLLAETELTAEQQTYTRAVGQSAKTLLGIIDEILDFSKIEAGRLDLRRAPFVLDECVQAVVELLAPRAHDKGLEIAWTMSDSLPRMVMGDETRVRQILMNLIGNAIKFTDRGGVRVRIVEDTATLAASDDIGLLITVEDTGIGIAPVALATIFSEFEQADPSMTRRHAGTGLGLAISRHLAEAMGGDVSARSQLGAGSVFSLRLRLGRRQQAGTIAQALAPLRTTRRILLALDTTIEATAMAETLTANGCTAVAARAADAADLIARAIAENRPFDVVMVDAATDSAANGHLLAAMRRASPASGDVKPPRGIVIIKACERDRLKDYRDQGFAGYLVRPVRAASLLAQIGSGVSATASAGPSVVTSTTAVMPSRGWRPNVLLAEDNDIGALLACAMLDKSDCDVTLTRNGADAVAAFQRSLESAGGRPFDLILMDVHMPEMDGLEATRRIRMLQLERNPASAEGDNHVPSPPVIALTANAFSEDRAQCLEAGMVDYIAKPFVKAELLAIIGKWCRHEAIGRGHGPIEVAAA